MRRLEKTEALGSDRLFFLPGSSPPAPPRASPALLAPACLLCASASRGLRAGHRHAPLRLRVLVPHAAATAAAPGAQATPAPRPGRAVLPGRGVGGGRAWEVGGWQRTWRASHSSLRLRPPAQTQRAHAAPPMAAQDVQGPAPYRPLGPAPSARWPLGAPGRRSGDLNLHPGNPMPGPRQRAWQLEYECRA